MTTDLLQSAKLFETSVLLETASDGIEKIAGGDSLSDPELEALKWTRAFLTQVDWDAAEGVMGATGNLAVPATTARPNYYESLEKLRSEFATVGLSGDQAVTQFVRNLLDDRAIFQKDRRQVVLASKLMREFALSLLGELNNNGLPQPFNLEVKGMV